MVISEDKTYTAQEGLLFLPDGVKVRWEDECTVNTNIVCLEAYLGAVKNNMLEQDSLRETMNVYKKLSGFIYSGLDNQPGARNFSKQQDLAYELGEISCGVGAEPINDTNDKLFKTGTELINLIKSEKGFTNYFNPEEHPDIVETYMEKGAKKAAKKLKKIYKKKGIGISTIINPWREYIMGERKIKW